MDLGHHRPQVEEYLQYQLRGLRVLIHAPILGAAAGWLKMAEQGTARGAVSAPRQRWGGGKRPGYACRLAKATAFRYSRLALRSCLSVKDMKRAFLAMARSLSRMYLTKACTSGRLKELSLT